MAYVGVRQMLLVAFVTLGFAAAQTITNATSRASTTQSSTLSTGTASGAPDVYLNVPTLSVGRIELVR